MATPMTPPGALPGETPPGVPPKKGSLPRQIAFAAVASFATLGVNLVTGLIVARGLGPAGRGATAALTSFALVFGWLAALGTNEGMNYLVATRPEDGRRLVGTCFVLTGVLGTIGAVVAQVVLPFAFSAQEASVVTVGRVFVLVVFLGVATTLFQSILAGNQDFNVTNLMKVLQPALYLLSLTALWVSGRLTVGSTLASAALSIAALAVYSAARVVRTLGIGRPSVALAREVGRYGLRAQGLILGGLGNSRLDFLILPSIVAAAPIGLYSVAVNSTSVLTTLAGSLGGFVLPVAARRGGRDGAVVVERMLRLTAVIGVAFGLPLFVLAPQLLSLVYGQEFVGATDALRILLLGVLFAMGSRVTDRALQAVNRPFAAGLGQLVALVVTVVGLALTLRPYGIIGAAATSAVAYFISFVISVLLLRRQEHYSMARVLDAGAMRVDVDRAIRGVKERFGRS